MVGNDVIMAILTLFQTSTMPSTWKNIFLVLILKIQHLSGPSDFRPISLCNTVYKLVVGILLNWMKPLMNDLISFSQDAFIGVDPSWRIY